MRHGRSADWDRHSRPLWAETAREPPPDCPPLAGAARADVAVIGAGYAGLGTAIHLADRGASVTVLEAEQPGSGASGRNGGQVIPGLRHFRRDLDAVYGAARGERLYAFGAGTADAVWRLVDRFAIACDPIRTGWIQAAHGGASLAESERRVAAWRRFGAPVEMLDRDAMRRLTGAAGYVGGWIDRRGGSVQPLAYARGLARGALGLGVRIHCGSRVTALERGAAGWTCRTAQGAVTAERVVVATTAYSDGLVPGLAASFVAVQSFQIATAPLSGEQRRRILPQGQCVSDMRNLLRYFRVDRDHRLVVGGRGTQTPARGPGSFGHQRLMLDKLYPELRGTALPHAWGGFVAVTPGRWPRLHEPAPGLIIPMGCNGKGVAWASAFGRVLADLALGGAERDMPLPIEPIARIPFPGLRRFYSAAATAYYRFQDARG
ncbi:MAG: FAD-binding oxidoreductase [Alphaproteobacteria bacterium]|nr:FAD-binding oxidoreductase [Alphaproteobacteria bacterium]